MPEETTSASTLLLLRGVELFSSLLDDDLAYVATRIDRIQLDAGAEFFSQEEAAGHFFILESGDAAIFRREFDSGAAGSTAGNATGSATGSATGAGKARTDGFREAEVARYVEGDALGDFEFAVNAKYSGSARALTRVSLIVFPSKGLSLADLAREKPGSTARILLRAASMVSSRLRSTQAIISKNATWVRELRRQIYTDPGTGLWSKAFLDEELPRLLEKPTAVILVKPDRFKDLNDANGHSAGDAAMERFAAMLGDQVERLGRGYALRLRSNEMALVLPRCRLGEATEIARFIAALTTAIDLSHALPGCTFTFTASMAIAVWPDDGENWRRLVDEAYSILTKAWKDGGARLYRLKARKAEA